MKCYLLAPVIALFVLGCARQKCFSVKAEFKDPNASATEKEATIEALHKRFDNSGMPADISIKDGLVLAEISCGKGNIPDFFRQDHFAIYETYDIAELSAVINSVAKISDSIASNGPEIEGAEGFTAYVPRLDEMLDMNGAGGACIGRCQPARSHEFMALIDNPHIKKILPADLSFMFGPREDGAAGLPVYAIKKSAVPPITVSMVDEANTGSSFDGTHYDVILKFKDNYVTVWERLTRKNTGKFLAIVMDDIVLTCPLVSGPIENGKATISSRFSEDQAEAMAQRINFSLPLTLLIKEMQTIK